MSRNGHYFQWFIVFGIIAGVVSYLGEKIISSEAIWLLAAGIIGLLIAHNSVKNGDFARIYDFIIGVIFIIGGVVGIVYNFSSSIIPTSTLTSSGVMAGSGQNAVLLGLSLALFPAIVHLLLGVTSFRHGLDNSSKKKS